MMKGSWKSTSINHITLSFLFLFIFHFQNVYGAPTKQLCRPEQRDALLEFKKEFEVHKPCFISPYPKTESWENTSDCCYWKGITCDAESREVIEIDLSFGCLHGQFHSNSSLFRLQTFHFLTSLDLSFNNFSNQIPSSIENLSRLTFLDLASNHFSGQIPSSLGNLSQLTYLSLSSNDLVGEIPSSFHNLNQLISLIFGYNKLSGNFHTELLNLTKLSELSLSHNQFTGTLPSNMSILSNLESFDASDNAFVGTLPSSIFTIPYLNVLDLRDNQLKGTLEFGNISSPSNLKQLYLGNNHFKGPIPGFISKLIKLDVLDLSRFNAQGPVDFCIFSHLPSLISLQLSHLNTTTTIDMNSILSCYKRLYTLDLSGIQVSVTNKSSIADPLSELRFLNLSGCGITEFPELIRTQREISLLILSNNMIKGHVPGWLWSLPKLDTVDLSNNSFCGFSRSTNMLVLDMRSNDFQGPFFVPPRPIVNLLASKNNFSGEIPKSICGMTSLQVLDLSYNNLNGSVPQCLENLSKKFLSVLNLAHNHLSGILPEIFINGTNLRSVNVGHNNFVGKLPRSLIGCSLLEVLNVEHNRFNDAFPFWLQPLKQLQVLVIRSNEFHGSLRPPNNISFGFLRLQIIDVSHNDFMETLPTDFFIYWSAMIPKGDIKEWRDNINYIGHETYYEDSLVLMNKGLEVKMERILTLLTAIDFSGNKLRGKIPESIGVLKDLIVLNLSNNHFEGHIPSTMANLSELESLDLSRNMLSGTIPPQLGKLTFVEFVDFSHNKLVGMIPGSTQFQTQNPSRFQDNVRLCGPPLDECGVFHVPLPSQQSGEEEEEVLNWIAAAIGFAPGIVLGLTVGYIAMSYKPHWFFKLFQLVSSFLRYANKKPQIRVN